LCLAAGTGAGTKEPKPKPVFTKAVRARTRALRVQRDKWRWLVVHHSGTKYGNAAIYDRQHRRRGMENGLAYHFVIGNGLDSGDGEIEIGQRWLKQLQGGHVHSEEVNETGIGICLVGDFEKSWPTRKQMLALRELVAYLRGEAVGKGLKFAVHREVDPNHTACPGRNFPVAEVRSSFEKSGRIS
jgi:N-acetyl-anhydromuramyl-L-alanine amidase AmpD